MYSRLKGKFPDEPTLASTVRQWFLLPLLHVLLALLTILSDLPCSPQWKLPKDLSWLTGASIFTDVD